LQPTIVLYNGAANYISFWTSSHATCTAKNVVIFFIGNSLLPVAKPATTYAHYKILSLWSGTGSGDADSTTRGTNWGGNRHFSFPVPLSFPKKMR